MRKIIFACILSCLTSSFVYATNNNDNIISASKTKQSLDSVGVFLLANNDDILGACRQYWRAGGALKQCNVVPEGYCYGNPFIRAEWDANGSCN